MENDAINLIVKSLVIMTKIIVREHIRREGSVNDEKIQNIASFLLVECCRYYGENADQIKNNLKTILDNLEQITLSDDYWIIRNIKAALRKSIES